jgi:hypothetical protein
MMWTLFTGGDINLSKEVIKMTALEADDPWNSFGILH